MDMRKKENNNKSQKKKKRERRRDKTKEGNEKIEKRQNNDLFSDLDIRSYLVLLSDAPGLYIRKSSLASFSITFRNIPEHMKICLFSPHMKYSSNQIIY
jgi:hypothetical protein